jgi:Uma2 family endonuclease
MVDYFGIPLMTTTASVILEDEVEIPFLGSLADFRAWALSAEFPQRGRIDYLDGRIEVDMSPEDLFTHNTLKSEIVHVLVRITKPSGLGYVFSDRARVSSPAARLSVEPDVVFVSYEAIQQQRVRLVPKASQEAGRYMEIEGAPDLVVEIVSDSSITKDTRRLPPAYHQAGVREFWLIDARREQLLFQIHHHAPAGFDPAPADAEGFQTSLVFPTGFRLLRHRDQRGQWIYDLETKGR